MNKEVKSVKANCYIADYNRIKELSQLATFKEGETVPIPEIIRRLLSDWESKNGNDEWPKETSQG